MEPSTAKAPLNLGREAVKEDQRNDCLAGTRPMGSEFPNVEEFFGFENFYNGHGFPGVRHSLDMAWLTSMPMATGLDETGNIDGTFEW